MGIQLWGAGVAILVLYCSHLLSARKGNPSLRHAAVYVLKVLQNYKKHPGSLKAGHHMPLYSGSRVVAVLPPLIDTPAAQKELSEKDAVRTGRLSSSLWKQAGLSRGEGLEAKIPEGQHTLRH